VAPFASRFTTGGLFRSGVLDSRFWGAGFLASGFGAGFFASGFGAGFLVSGFGADFFA
jgi:hypothetical protein